MLRHKAKLKHACPRLRELLAGCGSPSYRLRAYVASTVGVRLPIGWLSQISLPNLIFIPAAGKTIDDAALINLARERLAGFETPKRIVILHEFPTTVGGKIVKYKIRQMLNEPAS